MSTSSSPPGERFVDDVIAESDRLGRQVGDLLALSSLHAGAISIQPRLVELQPFLHEVAGARRRWPPPTT